MDQSNSILICFDSFLGSFRHCHQPLPFKTVVLKPEHVWEPPAVLVKDRFRGSAPYFRLWFSSSGLEGQECAFLAGSSVVLVLLQGTVVTVWVLSLVNSVPVALIQTGTRGRNCCVNSWNFQRHQEYVSQAWIQEASIWFTSGNKNPQSQSEIGCLWNGCSEGFYISIYTKCLSCKCPIACMFYVLEIISTVFTLSVSCIKLGRN